MIRIQNLSKRYGDLVAVDDVSFEFRSGETFGLLGPNGAGKTTTINMMLGVLEANSGTIEIDGEPDPTRPEIRRKLGNAPQSLAIYDELTAEENLSFFGRLYGMSSSRLRQRVDWALDFAGLCERRSHRVSTFSGGMKRRLNMACALVHDPPTLLFDEPTVGVDPQSRNTIFSSIEGLKKQGRTIVYTTHYMEEAERLCDRVAIMDRGRILAIGPVDELISKHGGHSLVTGTLLRPPSDPSRLPGKVDDCELRVETSQPLETIAELASSGCEFSKLNIDRADLETVFLNLTGRSLRD
ncbi:MAG: ABC transporter ATP-binding protein [Candidatus Zixiibacteriota bacterium]